MQSGNTSRNSLNRFPSQKNLSAISVEIQQLFGSAYAWVCFQNDHLFAPLRSAHLGGRPRPLPARLSERRRTLPPPSGKGARNLAERCAARSLPQGPAVVHTCSRPLALFPQSQLGVLDGLGVGMGVDRGFSGSLSLGHKYSIVPTLFRQGGCYPPH